MNQRSQVFAAGPNPTSGTRARARRQRPLGAAAPPLRVKPEEMATGSAESQAPPSHGPTVYLPPPLISRDQPTIPPVGGARAGPRLRSWEPTEIARKPVPDSTFRSNSTPRATRIAMRPPSPPRPRGSGPIAPRPAAAGSPSDSRPRTRPPPTLQWRPRPNFREVWTEPSNPGPFETDPGHPDCRVASTIAGLLESQPLGWAHLLSRDGPNGSGVYRARHHRNSGHPRIGILFTGRNAGY